MVLQYVEADELDEAQTLCRAILDMAPGHARAQHQLGLLARQAGHLPEAAAYLLGALQAAPDEESHWLAYIDVLLTARELTAAAETIALARRNGLRGAAFDALGKRLARAERGTPSRKEVDALSALLLERRLDEAMQAAHAMTVDCPHDAFGWQSLSAVFYMRGQIAPALEAMSKALECTPDSAKVLSNVGLLLKESRRHEQAIDHLKRALELDPTLFDAHVNLAACLLNINCFAEAEASARAAAGIDPKNALAWNNVAIAMASQGRFVGAVDAYRRALALDPANARVHSNMLFSMSQMDGIDADALFAEHVRYGEQVEAPLRKHWRAHANERDPQRPLRIGFLSGDLRHHAVTSFVEPIFARMAGRPGLSLHAYHNHLVTDHVSQRLQGYMAQWTEVVGMDDDTLAQRIRDDGIDILVDLSGHTALNRLPVLARKPAPVQVTWIGYPGTTGLESVDYYLTERALLPPGQFDHQFTEKLVYLPLSAPSSRSWTPPRSIACRRWTTATSPSAASTGSARSAARWSPPGPGCCGHCRMRACWSAAYRKTAAPASCSNGSPKKGSTPPGSTCTTAPGCSTTWRCITGSISCSTRSPIRAGPRPCTPCGWVCRR
jgi:tetratricopeptide (TPR) repeat protein